MIYSTALKQPRMQLVADMVSGLTPAASTGSPAAGSLVIGTSALSGSTGVLATVPLNATMGTVSGSVLTLSGVPLSATAAASGTPALAELRNSSGVTIVSGLTVGLSSADIIVSSSPITGGGVVSVTSGTITHG